MHINPHLYTSLLLSAALFALGRVMAQKTSGNKRGIAALLLLLTLPALSMLLYYLHLVKLPNWYIEFRALPAVELSVAFFGLFFGFLSDIKSQYALAFLTLALVFVPFVKPIVRPLAIKEVTEWKDDVCIQSTAATCGPSSLATICRYYGIEATEYDITNASYSCSSGTEIWYVLRHARQKGLRYSLHTAHSFEDLKFPAIIGTRLGGIGHFITVLGKSERGFVFGDPLQGRLDLNKADFEQKYKLDGMMIVFTKADT